MTQTLPSQSPVSMPRSRREIAAGVYRVMTGLSNAYLVQAREKAGTLAEAPAARPWVLIDAGSEGWGKHVLSVARSLFDNTPPAAVLLTHGHFDHAGGLRAVLQACDVPVYAHRLEKPYLNRHVHYPPGDPTVGGFMPELSRFMYTSRPVDVPAEVRELPRDGSVPHLPGWRWIETPGHTPGHVSFYDEVEGTLVAGDAVVTVNTDSILGTLTMRRELAHPPAYATYDWPSARRSVQAIADLNPLTIAAGHGSPLTGPGVAEALSEFAQHFPMPRYGRYVRQPVRFNENGPIRIPPRIFDPVQTMALVVGGLWLAGKLMRRRA